MESECRMRRRRLWSPFKKNGKLNVTLYTDPWRKRLWARLRRQPLWHQLGSISEDDRKSPRNMPFEHRTPEEQLEVDLADIRGTMPDELGRWK